MTSALITVCPSYSICEDRPGGIIHISVEGFFDIASLDRHFAENAEVVSRWRMGGRPIRVFIDACDLQPHSPGGQAFVQDATARIYEAGDRVAIRVCSSLVKMQMRRALSHGDIVNFFISKEAALMWLGPDLGLKGGGAQQGFGFASSSPSPSLVLANARR